MAKTYEIVFTLTVNAGTDEHLQTPESITSEIRSWLEGLRATVSTITVRENTV